MGKLTNLYILKEILMEHLLNDYENENSIYYFDIIDYYELTDIPITRILIDLDTLNLNYNERKVLRSFVGINYTPKIDDINLFINEKFKEKLVLNEIEVTLDMKKHAIEVLLEKNIPINLKTYQAMIKKIFKDMEKENTRER